MKRSVVTLCAAACIAIGAAVAPQAASAATSAQTEVRTASPIGSATMSTGQYEYICIGSDGSSWSLRVGEPTTDCHGSFLHKYISGVMVANYKLSVTGTVIDHPKPDPIGCLMSIVSGVFGVLSADGSLIWISALGFTGMGGIMTCLA
ncbi:hypothetical protein [Microbacterium sp. PF5]|uniref:hypothetical protein n=1 Tax=Microbacterium sp. PF5 TaxID=2305435 RepID=UPI00109B92BA|nr:hypothetical protein [Microbacterium sp. PF5]